MNEPVLDEETLTYARLAMIHRIYATVLYQKVRTRSPVGFLAQRLRWTVQQMTNCLEQPEGWTLDTVSDLLLAMNCEIAAVVIHPFPELPTVPQESAAVASA